MFQDGSKADREAFSSLISSEANYVDPMFDWCDRLMRHLEVDRTEICLLTCISLFRYGEDETVGDVGGRVGGGGGGGSDAIGGTFEDAFKEQPTFNRTLLNHYKRVLKAYQHGRKLKVVNKFERLMTEMTRLKAITALQNKMLHTLDKNMLPKLLREEIWSQHVDGKQ